jgi:hypothetical protein
MIKIGYGQSNFGIMVRDNFYYVDRTMYLEKLENLGSRFLFFLRPRRFGKSLFISLLEHYYGLEYKSQFTHLFGKYYIGSNPSPTANSFLILTFDFSGIDTSSLESTQKGFNQKVKKGIKQFEKSYQQLFPTNFFNKLLEIEKAEIVVDGLFTEVQNLSHKIYLLIDEYDHFTNELISFNLENFKSIVSRNGFVRKFYETIKTATRDGAVERIFVTGVSPVTVDSLTSGFNIATQITLDPHFHNMMGFTKAEVTDILRGIEVEEKDFPEFMIDLKSWYDGYLFNRKVTERLYNSDMVLYFANYYSQYKEYPEKMLDDNIASDFSKIRKIFRIGGFENEKLHILDKLIRGEKVLFPLTSMFSFEKKNFPTEDLLSLLFYMGFLTIKKMWGDKYEMEMPNKVIRDIYFDYFLQIMEERAQTNRDLYTLGTALDELIWENNPRPILEVLAVTLRNLTHRDFRNMDEKHIQAMFFSYLNLSKMYNTKSEYESEKKYYDIVMLETPIAEAKYEFIFEFKYERKAGETRIETISENAKSQMQKYLSSRELSNRPKMKGWVVVVVGDEIETCQEVFL